MALDWQQIVNLLVTAGFACVGYFYAQIIADTKKDRQMLNDLRVDLPSKYVSKAAINASGGTFVYAAFAENPFNSSRAR